MSDSVSGLTMFRDVLLLFINAGMLMLLFIIAGQMNGQRQRSKTVPKQVTDLLEKILGAQKKAASALVTTNNEFRNHLKNMVINVESSTSSSSDAPGAAPPLGDFKALRRDFERIESQFAGTLEALRQLTEQTSRSISELSMALQTDRKSERKLTTEFQGHLRADLEAQAARLQKAVSEISFPVPTAVTVSGSGQTSPAPVVDLNGPLNKWFNRTQELHNNLIKEIRGIGGNFKLPTEQLTQAADANVAKLRTILESFMIENARHDRQTEEFHRSLRADFQAQANLLGKVVADSSSRDDGQAMAASPAVSTSALDQSLKQWLGRTQELHESMLQKIQASGGGKSNGNGNGSEFAARDLRNTIDQHHESLRKLLQDFMTENIRHNQNAEEFRSEFQQDIKTQADRLKQLADARPAGTATASMGASGESDPEWRDKMRNELHTIIDKLDRMHERMEEIFQI